MKRAAFSTSDSVVESFILVPENETDRNALREALDDQGVCDRMGFVTEEINGSLRFPDVLEWDSGGAVEVSVATDSGQIKAWFWIVTIGEGSDRGFAWWNTEHDHLTAEPWNK